MFISRPHLGSAVLLALAACSTQLQAASGIETAGSARFTVITPYLIRMEYAVDGKFVDAASWFARNRAALESNYQVLRSGNTLTIDTGVIQLTYQNDGKSFSENNLQAKIKNSGSVTSWHAGMEQSGNLGGSITALDRVRMAIPLTPGLISRDGWYLLDDSKTVLASGDWYQERPKNNAVDWYFFGYGLDYKAALQSLTRISGDVPLPRKFTMGIWYSRNWAYKQDEWKEVIEEFRTNNFPLDVVVVDFQWHTKDWTGYTWNRELLPDPKSLLDWFHQQGLAVAFNDHPDEGVLPKEEMYADFMKAMGQDPASKKTIPFDGGDKRYLDTFYAYTHEPIMKMGVDFWWLDWKKPTTPSLPALNGLALMNDYNFKVTSAGGMRGQSFSRWAGWGDHRAPIHFSGDAQTGWKMLAFEVALTSTAGNMGCFYWSHDIGGYRGARDEESYTRWCQFGALSPALRPHSTSNKQLDRRPWKWGDWATESMRKFFALRAQLIPYVYTCAADSARQSLPFVRPMYINNPTAEAAYHNGQQYYFGENLLVAPITMPGYGANRVAWQHVWFPEGTWYQYFSGEKYARIGDAIVAADINEMPLFVRGGVPLPEQPYNDRPTTAPLDHLVLRCFPGADGQTGVSHLYEDDGVTDGYKTGNSATTELSYTRRGDQITIRIAPTQGRYRGQVAAREYTVLLPNMQAGKLTSHAQAKLTYDAANGINRIDIAETSIDREIILTLTAAELDAAQVSQKAQTRRLDGLLDKPYAQWTEADRASMAPGILAAAQAIRGVGLMPFHQHPYLYGYDSLLTYINPSATQLTDGTLLYKSWSKPIAVKDGQVIDYAALAEAVPPADTIRVPNIKNFIQLTLNRQVGLEAAGVDPVDIAYNLGNIAMAAKITTNKGRGEGANDGVANGDPGYGEYEWSVPPGETQAWARLDWPNAVKAKRVLLYDRPSPDEQVLAGKLIFSDGSTLDVGALPNDGRTPAEITFPEKQITWVKFEVLKVSPTTKGRGLSEFAVFDR